MSIAGERVPALRFPEFEGAWEEALASEHFEFRNGLNFVKGLSGQKVKVLGVADFQQNERFENSDSLPVVQLSGALDERDHLQKGDLLFVRSNGNKALIGRCLLIGDIDPDVSFSGFTIRARLTTGKLSSSFASKPFRSNLFRRYLDVAGGGTNISNLSQEILRSYSYRFPTLPEQKKIAAFLGVVDAKIAGLKARQDGLERYKRGLMQALFSQRLRFTKPDGTAFPDWEEKRLGEVLSVEMGQSPSSSSYNDRQEGLPLIQGNADVKFRLSAPRRYTSEITKICEVGDILLSVRAPVGETSKAIHRACIGRGIAALRAKNIQRQEFWHQFLLRFEPRWAALEQGSTFAAISGPDIRSLKVKAPHPDEQQKIADALQAMDAKISAVAGQVAKMEAFKKGLLQQMFV